ncbi:MAG TPA: hypothetical protein VJP86_05565 [Vicinamibacterales bacterium]|jgi:hypothetical protein|nr:hypothetical protein [Vicinamibacterales bacterium]
MFGVGFRRVGFVFVALIIGLPAVSFAQLPAKDYTPGKTLKVTKEEVCSAGFVSPAKPLKDNDAADALAAYGLRPDSGRELIHLVPLSLGGTNDKANLWPLPNSREFGPAQKKALDEALQKKVCDGSIDLKTAQDALKKNWMDAYKKYVGQ